MTQENVDVTDYLLRKMFSTMLPVYLPHFLCFLLVSFHNLLTLIFLDSVSWSSIRKMLKMKKLYVQNCFLHLMCFEVEACYTTQADLCIVRAGLKFMIFTLPPMGGQVCPPSPVCL